MSELIEVQDDDSSLVHHCRVELQRLAALPESLVTPEQADALVAVARAFTGHSGGSAPYSIAILADVLGRVLSYEPLTPLTGLSDEWVPIDADQIGRAGVLQNRRDGRVFREIEHDTIGGPGPVDYSLDRVVWTELRWRRPYRDLGEPAFPPMRPYASSFTGWDSRRRISFPYTPTTPRRVWHRLRWLDRLGARLSGKLVTA